MRTVSHAHNDIHSLISRLSLSVYTDVQNITTPTRPRSYVSRRHPGPMYVILTPFTTQHRYHAHVSIVFLSSTLCDRISGYTPEPGPAPSPASGFRPSGLPTPVSTGVPTGARNLGVCVILFCVSFRNHPLVLRFLTPLTLCYRHPTFFYTISSRTLVFPSRTTYRFPRILRVGRPSGDLRRRWVELPCARKPSLSLLVFLSPLF